MVSQFEVGTRARAKAAMRRMVESAEGNRLAPRPRRPRAGQVAHALGRIAELIAVFGLVAAAALAIRLAKGPIYLEALHDKIASSLQERTGDGYKSNSGRPM